MNNKTFSLKNYLDKKNINVNLFKRILKKFTKFEKEIHKEINNPSKTLNILSQNFKLNFKFEKLKSFKKYKTIAIIGMGGSILGAEAIKNFFGKKVKKKIYFFNNLDPEYVSSFKKKEKTERVLFLIISKSGNTIETLSNFFSLNIIKKNSKNIIIITEKSNNILYNLAQKFNLFYIEHKKTIGGRYSILSEIGIIPSYLMGLNTNKFRKKIRNPLSKKI